MERPAALVVDRDPGVRALAVQVLEEQGFDVAAAETPAGAGAFPRIADAILALIEIDTTDSSTLICLERLGPSALVVGLGAPAAGAESIDPLRARLSDVLAKPVDRSRIASLAQRALGTVGRDSTAGSRAPGPRLVGASAAMQSVRSQLTTLSRGADPVWLVGEPGTGRAAAAASIHSASARRSAAFVAVDCADLRDVDRLLAHDGRLDRAQGGSLFLGDLPELRLDRQDDLLHEIERRGATDASSAATGVRLLVGSRVDRVRAVDEGRLLEDLGRRLAGATLYLPPLRERREDVPALATSFVAQICEMNNLPPIRISASALSVLERYAWPGNVEELRGAIEQAVIVSSDEIVRPADLPERIREATVEPDRPSIPAGVSARPFRDAKRDVVEAFEKVYLGELLERHQGNVTAAAQHAGMLRSALQRLLRKYRFKSADFRRTRKSARPSAGRSADDPR